MGGKPEAPPQGEWMVDDRAIRERLHPEAGDFEYLPLSDLRLFIGRFATDARIRMLDYGSGNSPYRPLFPNAEYRRADVTQAEGLDYLIGADSSLPAHAGAFDLILSTQVAEHLEDPLNYFRESWRVLKPGGTLVVTTHGAWEEHGAPYDYQRWTTMGLERDLRRAGIPSAEIFKITAGDRAGLFLTFRWLRTLRSDRSWLARKVTGRLRATAAWLQAPIFRWCDRRLADLRVADPAQGQTPALYIVLAAVAKKARD